MKIASKWEYVMVKAGSTVVIASPDWDGDDPSTHINLIFKLSEDICVCVENEQIDGEVLSSEKHEEPTTIQTVGIR